MALTWTPTLYKDKTSYYQSYGFFFWSTYNLSFTCLVVGISSKKKIYDAHSAPERF